MTIKHQERVEAREPTRQPIRVPWSRREQDVVSRFPSSNQYIDVYGGGFTMLEAAEAITRKAYLKNFSHDLDTDWLIAGPNLLSSQSQLAGGVLWGEHARTDVRDLSRRIDELSDKIRTLSARVADHPATTGTRHKEPYLLHQVDLTTVRGSQLTGDDWSDFFEWIADGNSAPTNAIRLAREALHSEDGSVRSAAARALSVLSPGEALEILPEFLERESNKYVRAALLSALESAAL